MGQGQPWACPTHPALLPQHTEQPDPSGLCGSTRPAPETAGPGTVASTMCLCLCGCSSLCLEAPPRLACKSWLPATRSHHSPAALGPNSDHHCPDAKDLHLMGLAGGQALSQAALSPEYPSSPAGQESSQAPQPCPRLACCLTWPRGQWAPNHKDPPQQIVLEAARLTEKWALSLGRPQAPLGERGHGAWGPTRPGHSQPPFQKEKQLLWSHLPHVWPHLVSK